VVRWRAVVQRPVSQHARGGFPETRTQPDKGEIGPGVLLNPGSALEWLLKWYKAQAADVDIPAFRLAQIGDYETLEIEPWLLRQPPGSTYGEW